MPRWIYAAGLLAFVLALAPATAWAHRGNPHYRSIVESVTPATPGVKVTVINFDDRLQLVNRSREDVLVRGYRGEPYAQVRADGAVLVNQNSPATYLNEERLGNTEVPRKADEKARPDWKLVDRTGRFQWHDHRFHWMGRNKPPQVKDQDKRQRVFGWKVPLTIGGRNGAITGILDWVPLAGGNSSLAVPLVMLGLLLALVALLLLYTLRAKRRRDGEEAKPEAW